MEQRFRVPITVATLLVIPVMIVQGSDTGQPWQAIGFVGDCVIWLTFLAEVIAMLAVAEDRWAWVKKNPLDVAIVVLTPPVPGNVLASVRILRLFRLVRLFRLAPLMRGVFTIDGVKYVAFLAFLTLLAGGQAFASIESDQSIADGLYWALGTMTTAGSGDVMATTGSVEAVAAVLMLVGLAFAAVITGAIAQRFVVTEDTVTEGNLETLEALAAVTSQLDEVGQRLDRLDARFADLAEDSPGGSGSAS